MSRNIQSKVRRFVKWAQKGKCMLCSFTFHLHLHHIISVDDGGPDHHLNLVALCPNHHFLIEKIKRQVAPKKTARDGDWMQRAEKAIQLRDNLDQSAKQLLDVLAKPHPFSDFEMNEDALDISGFIAQDLMEKDVEILDQVNRRRPRIFLGSPSKLKSLTGTKQNPYSLKLLGNKELQGEIDRKAAEVAADVGDGTYREVINRHMLNLEIPHVAVPA